MDLVLVRPKISSFHIPDTIQTPPDTTRTLPFISVLCNIGHWKKRQCLSFMTFYNFLQMYFVLIHHKQLETPSRHHPDIPRHHPDTLRHKHLYAIQDTICIKTPVSWLCLGVFGWCLDGVWIRSESVWGCIKTKSVGNNIVLDHDTQILPFILVPCIA